MTEHREEELVFGTIESVLGAVTFHHGPSPTPQGLTNEVLIAVMLDRLRGWQSDSETRCRENAIMITNLEETLMWARARAERLEDERAEEEARVAAVEATQK